MSSADLHPVAHLIAQSLVQRGSTWALPATAAARVRMTLLAQHEDRAVGEAVRTVFAMASVLRAGAGDPAAKGLIRALGKVRDDLVPRLRGCDPKGLALGRQLLEQARSLLPLALRATASPVRETEGGLTCSGPASGSG